MPTPVWVVPKREAAASVADQDSTIAADPDDAVVPAVSSVHASPEEYVLSGIKRAIYLQSLPLLVVVGSLLT